MSTRKINKRNSIITVLNIVLILIIIFFWIYGIVGYDLQKRNVTDFFNSSEYIFNCTFIPFTYQYTWLIPIPFTFILLLFPGNFLISNVINMFCPIAFMKRNNKYFSCQYIENPEECEYSVTINIPVYKENFEKVIKPTLKSLIKCRTYYLERMNINILVSDDGLQFLDIDELSERLFFYNDNNISYIGRPIENRMGKFKKASNLNFTMNICRLFGVIRKEYGFINSRDINEIMHNLLHLLTFKTPTFIYNF